MTRCASVIAIIILQAISAFCDAPPTGRVCVVCGRDIPRGETTWVLPAQSETILDHIRNGAILPTQVYTNTDPKSPDGLIPGVYVRICDTCRQINVRCSLCGLPVKDQGVRTSDGRTICPREAATVIMDEDGARELFQSAREAAVDVADNFFALKNPSVNVRITDVFDAHSKDKLHTLAISKSTRAGSEVVHYVSINTGRLKSEAFYSCVHEYTHLWINENIEGHNIEPSTIEGLCELMAYKVAEARGDVAAQKEILANPYTKGRVNQLVQYASEEDLAVIFAWVKNGTSPTLTEGLATATQARLKPADVPLDVQVARAQLARPHPQIETLSINGTIHGAKGTLILLNGGLILGKGEAGVVKLNGQSLKIRCVDIQADIATFRYENATNVVTLSLQRH